jgi:hypothetical protein
MARDGSGFRRARSIVALSANRRGTHGPRPRGMSVLRNKVNEKIMDEDTKLVLQMWRVQVMVNDHLQRRVDALERELGDVYAGKRIDHGRADADWRASGSDRRRSDDSND